MASAHLEPQILLVEDNPVDVLMIRRALKNCGFKEPPLVMNDGEPALAFLSGRSHFEGAALPDLVILDLNLRKVDGPEVLSFIRRTAELKSMCVIILSSSPEDVMKANAGQADYFIEKPTDAPSFLNLGNRIRDSYRESARKRVKSAAT